MTQRSLFTVAVFLWTIGVAHAQPPAAVAAHVTHLTEPVQRIGDLRLQFPNGATVFSPDGKTLLGADSGSADTLIVDVAAGAIRGRLKGNEYSANQIAFAADSKQAWSGAQLFNTFLWRNMGTLILWDLSTQEALWKLRATAWDLSPDGKTIVTLESRLGLADARNPVPSSYSLSFYDVARRQAVHQQSVSKMMASVIAFAPDGKHIAFAQSDCRIKIIDVANYKEIRTLQAPKERDFTYVGFLSWSPDATQLVSVSEEATKISGERTLCVWDASTGQLSRKLQAPDGQVRGIAWSPDGGTLVVATQQGGWRIFDGKSGDVLRTESWPASGAIALALYKYGKVPQQGQDCPQLIKDLWDQATGIDVTSGARPDRLFCLALSPDEKTLATGETGGIVRLWSIRDGKELKRLAAAKQAFPYASVHGWQLANSAAHQPHVQDSVHHLLYLDTEHANRVRKTALGGLHEDREGEVERARNKLDGLKDFSAGMLISSHWSGTLRLWNAATGQFLHVHDHAYSPRPVSMTQDGRILLGEGNRIRLWPTSSNIETDLRNIAQLHAVPGSAQVIALASFGHPPVLVDWQARKIVRKFGAGSVTNVAVSPNGTTLVTYGRKEHPGWNVEDKFVRLWDIATGNEWGRLAAEPAATYGVWFAPGGYAVLVRHGDGLRLWEIASRQERAFIKSLASGSVAFSRDGRLLFSLPTYAKHVSVWDLTCRQKVGPLDAEHLDAKQLKQLWLDVSGEDAKKAYEAIWRFAAAEDAAPFIEEQIKRMPALDRKQLPALIADLDAPQFTRRDHAMKELPKLGRWAESSLRSRLDQSPSLESKMRVEQLLRNLQEQPYSSEQILALRIIEALERMQSPSSRQLLQWLRDGDKPQFSEPAKDALAR